LRPAHAPDGPTDESALARRVWRVSAILVVVGCVGGLPATSASADLGAALAAGEAPLTTDITGLVILLLLFFSVLTASLHLV
jgi:hypothetical protein